MCIYIKNILYILLIVMEQPIKNAGGRPLKVDKFQNEQNQIFKKMNNILGLTDDNNTFYLYTIDDDQNKQDQIMALLDDCKKYFNSAKWVIFNKTVNERRYLSLIRSVYRAMGYKLESIMRTFKEDNKTERRTGYIVSKKEDK